MWNICSTYLHKLGSLFLALFVILTFLNSHDLKRKWHYLLALPPLTAEWITSPHAHVQEPSLCVPICFSLLPPSYHVLRIILQLCKPLCLDSGITLSISTIGIFLCAYLYFDFHVSKLLLYFLNLTRICRDRSLKPCPTLSPSYFSVSCLYSHHTQGCLISAADLVNFVLGQFLTHCMLPTNWAWRR